MPGVHQIIASAQAPFRVTLLVLPGTRALMVGGLADPLSLTQDMPAQIVSIAGRHVPLAAGGELAVEGSLREAEGECLIVLAPTGAEGREAARAIARASDRYPIIGAVGGGIALLAQAGLLEGRTVTCPLDTAGQPLPFIAPARLKFTESAIRLDDNRLTAASDAAAATLALALIEARSGTAEAASVARRLGLALPRPPADDLPETEAPRPDAADPRVAAAIARMRASLTDPPSAAEIARDLNLSPRRLEGLFRAEFGTGPGGYALNLRLEAAQRMLTETRMAVADVARATGFSSAGTLARAFRGRFGQSPSDLRRTAISAINHGIAGRG